MALRNKHSAAQGHDKKAAEKRARLETQRADKARETRKRHLKGDRSRHSKNKIKSDVLRVARQNLDFPGTCSRDRYRKFGHYPEVVVFDHFGTFTELQRYAGLRDGREVSAQKLSRARLAFEEEILEYVHKHVPTKRKPYKPKAHKGRFRDFAVISDLHGLCVDRFVLSTFLDVLARTQPEHVVLNGDVPEFAAVSSWTQNPHRIVLLQEEIDFTRDTILAKIREAAPHAQIDWIMGNHEYRLIRYLAGAGRALSSLRDLRFDHLFRLEELQINFVCRSIYEAPKESVRKKVVQENEKVYYDCFVVTHGEATGKLPAHAELSRRMMSGTSGHVHNPCVAFLTTPTTGPLDWVCTGMAAGRHHGDDFVWGPTRWGQSFNFATVDTKRKSVLQQPVLFKGDVAHFAGTTYERTSQ